MIKKLKFSERYLLYKEIKANLVSNELKYKVNSEDLFDRIIDINIPEELFYKLQDAYNKYKGTLISNKYLDMYFSENLIDFKIKYFMDKYSLLPNLNILLKKYYYFGNKRALNIDAKKLILEFILSIIDKKYMLAEEMTSYEKIEHIDEIKSCVDYINEEIRKDNQLYTISLNKYIAKVNKYYMGYSINLSDIEIDGIKDNRDKSWLLDSIAVKEKYSSINSNNRNLVNRLIRRINTTYDEDALLNTTKIISLFRGMDKIEIDINDINLPFIE